MSGKTIQKYGTVSEKYVEMQKFAKKQGGKVAKFSRDNGGISSGQYCVVDKKGNIVRNAPTLFWAGKGENMRFDYISSEGNHYISGEHDKQAFRSIQYNDGRVAIDKNKDGNITNDEVHLDTRW